MSRSTVHAANYARVLDEVRGLSWPFQRRAPATLLGAHPSRARGAAGEFDEYRPYRQGSEVRRIDWKLFARTDRAYLRIALEPAVVRTRVVLDATESMAFPPDQWSKWRLASSVALGLLAVARSNGDPAALSIVCDTCIRLPAQTGSRASRQALALLERTTPCGSRELAPELARMTRPGARIAVISDFLGDADAMLIAARRALARNCEVHAVHVIDAGELQPDPALGFVRDPEQVEVVRPVDRRALDGYAAAFRDWRNALRASWIRAGARFVTAITGAESFAHLVRRITAEPPAKRST